MRLFISALLALNVALAYSKPSNSVKVESSAESQVAVAGENKKGDGASLFDSFQSDAAMIKLCVEGSDCSFATVGEAKALDYSLIASLSAVKAEPSPLSKALTPSMATMSESIRSLQAQKLLLESLEAQMAALTSASAKGQQLSESAKGQFAEAVTKGVQFSPNNKGLAAAPTPPKGMFAAQAPSQNKGFAMPPSKGGSSANTMQYEAMMCPMTMFELGKCQKVVTEEKMMLQAAASNNAKMAAEKQRLEGALQFSEAMKTKAEMELQQMAKLYAEEKAKNAMLVNALTECEEVKEVVISQRDALEVELKETQEELVNEKSLREACDVNLAGCQAVSADLQTRLDAAVARGDRIQDELDATKQRLQEEIERAITCEENLGFCNQRLAKSEEDLANERAEKEQCESTLMATMNQLAACQRESKVLSERLSVAEDELQAKAAELAREQAYKEAAEAKVAQLTQELRDTEEQLRQCNTDLNNERNNVATCNRKLGEAEAEVDACNNRVKDLRDAIESLSQELDETKTQLNGCNAEKDQLRELLAETSTELENMTIAKEQCDVERAECNVAAKELSEQLATCIVMVEAEKKAREELTATIQIVQQTSMKVQEEVKKLQLENLALAQQVQKLQSEQEVALALAAGCPPTYEKFGSSCYKYVREKTPWKMAQEQCMKDQGNLVAVEDAQEQMYLVDYLKRMDASDDPYAFTSGHKKYNGWKWLGTSDTHVNGAYWYNAATSMKPGYDCMSMYLADSMNFGKWIGLPCYNAAPYVCEYKLVPDGTVMPANPAETLALQGMAAEAPLYLRAGSSSKGVGFRRS